MPSQAMSSAAKPPVTWLAMSKVLARLCNQRVDPHRLLVQAHLGSPLGKRLHGQESQYKSL